MAPRERLRLAIAGSTIAHHRSAAASSTGGANRNARTVPCGGSVPSRTSTSPLVLGRRRHLAEARPTFTTPAWDFWSPLGGGGYPESLTREPGQDQAGIVVRSDHESRTSSRVEARAGARRSAGSRLRPVSAPVDQLLLIHHLAHREGFIVHAAGFDLRGLASSSRASPALARARSRARRGRTPRRDPALRRADDRAGPGTAVRGVGHPLDGHRANRPESRSAAPRAGVPGEGRTSIRLGASSSPDRPPAARYRGVSALTDQERSALVLGTLENSSPPFPPSSSASRAMPAWER